MHQIKKIHIGITNFRGVLCIPNPSEERKLLKTGERTIQNFFYRIPRELESFLKTNENQEQNELFPQAFAYWVLCSFSKKQEDKNQYGMLKRDLYKFSQKLYRKLRKLAMRIAKKVGNFFSKGKRTSQHNQTQQQFLRKRKGCRMRKAA